ncbi:MAG: hypothetical protein JW864_08025 [Spirochaetes bacterium]|nr:hypothetical protein [Spirochaetota bacterium]
MELNEIIKTDKDRLFALDNECFIIFTADDLTDEKPFIRIGNWIDLPPESIPLIENIIVTDSITGNPSHEQFNIDPKFLSTNRYIGSRKTVQNYLDFQKNFDLDLNNVSIVDVEKDLPSFSKEKSISSKDAFLGVFYYNGNFKVEFNDKKLFDLKEFEGISASAVKILENASIKNKESVQYAGSGIAILNNSPIFYKNRFFTMHQYPAELPDFDSLNIDPGKLREILVPELSLVNITDFFKWKNGKGGLIKLYSDSKEKADSLQKLFPNLIIKTDIYKECRLDTGDGLTVENYKDSTNIRITYRNVSPSSQRLALSYLNEYSGLQQILKEKLDCFIVPYTIFEKANLFFKSTTVPVLCIDDGNKNISRLKIPDSVILRQNIQYEFKKSDDLESLLRDSYNFISDLQIVEFLKNIDLGGIRNFLNEGKSGTAEDTGLNRTIDILNTFSILKIYLKTTSDRKLSSEIGRTLQKKITLTDEIALKRMKKGDFKITLFFFNKMVFEFFEPARKPDLNLSEADKESEFQQRIETDRERFRKLLSLYKNTIAKSKKEFTQLSNEISKRKENFNTDLPSVDHKKIKRNILSIKLKKIRKVLFIILILAVIAALSFTGYKAAYRYFQEYTERQRTEKERLARIEEERRLAEEEEKRLEAEKIRAEKLKNEKKELIARYNIHVSDRDIYVYANKVALKNGYREITFKALKEKNPNWIFPENVFYLMDGEKIVVKWGDTLWDISHRKLMEINIEFYKLIDKIKAANSDSEKAVMLEKAKDIAFSRKHVAVINSFIKK